MHDRPSKNLMLATPNPLQYWRLCFLVNTVHYVSLLYCMISFVHCTFVLHIVLDIVLNYIWHCPLYCISCSVVYSVPLLFHCIWFYTLYCIVYCTIHYI